MSLTSVSHSDTSQRTSPFLKLVTSILVSKSLQRSPVVGDFYETAIEIWAGFGPVGITEKNKHLGQLGATFEAGFFKFSWAIFFYRLRNIFNCVLFHQRHLTAVIIYNDFDWSMLKVLHKQETWVLFIYPAKYVG